MAQSDPKAGYGHSDRTETQPAKPLSEIASSYSDITRELNAAKNPKYVAPELPQSILPEDHEFKGKKSSEDFAAKKPVNDFAAAPGNDFSGKQPDENDPRNDFAGTPPEAPLPGTSPIEDDWGYQKRRSSLTKETKIGMALIGVLVVAFSVVVWKKFTDYRASNMAVAAENETKAIDLGDEPVPPEVSLGEPVPMPSRPQMELAQNEPGSVSLEPTPPPATPIQKRQPTPVEDLENPFSEPTPIQQAQPEPQSEEPELVFEEPIEIEPKQPAPTPVAQQKSTPVMLFPEEEDPFSQQEPAQQPVAQQQTAQPSEEFDPFSEQQPAPMNTAQAIPQFQQQEEEPGFEFEPPTAPMPQPVAQQPVEEPQFEFPAEQPVQVTQTPTAPQETSEGPVEFFPPVEEETAAVPVEEGPPLQFSPPVTTAQEERPAPNTLTFPTEPQPVAQVAEPTAPIEKNDPRLGGFEPIETGRTETATNIEVVPTTPALGEFPEEEAPVRQVAQNGPQDNPFPTEPTPIPPKSQKPPKTPPQENPFSEQPTPIVPKTQNNLPPNPEYEPPFPEVNLNPQPTPQIQPQPTEPVQPKSPQFEFEPPTTTQTQQQTLTPNPQPTSPTVTVPPGQQAPAKFYEVQPGENYWSISKKVYGTPIYFMALTHANAERIPDPKKMRPGMKVLTPPPQELRAKYPQLFAQEVQKPVAQQNNNTDEYGFFRDANGRPMYKVGPEDTLSAIAHQHLGRASRWIQIYQLNRQNIPDPNRLKIGTIILLPNDASRIGVAQGN